MRNLTSNELHHVYGGGNSGCPTRHSKSKSKSRCKSKSKSKSRGSKSKSRGCRS